MVAVPLRTLGLVRRVLGLGPRLLLGTGVGRVAPRRWHHRLAAVAAALPRSSGPRASLARRRCAGARPSPRAAVRCALAVLGGAGLLPAARPRASVRQRCRGTAHDRSEE